MENVMTNGFCELNEQEMIGTDGGGWWSFWENVGANFYEATHPQIDIYGHNNGGPKHLAPDPTEFGAYRCI